MIDRDRRASGEAKTSEAKTCCADLYQSPVARLILGDSLHPGGLRLTHRLGTLMGIRPNDWVVDLACGPGASSMAVSRTFRCRVVGVEFGSGAVSEALASAQQAAVVPNVFFLRGDAELPPFKPSSVDAVLCECSLSIFSDQPSAASQVARMLRPGGAVGFSDVTLDPGSFPGDFPGPVGQALCLAGALDVEGYARLADQAGLVVEQREDASHAIVELLDDLEEKLAAFAGFRALAPDLPSFAAEYLDAAPGIFRQLRRAVQEGDLGYWLFVARKPA